MEILSFEKFRLILEAEGDPNGPAGQPASGQPAASAPPSEGDPASTPVSTPTDSSQMGGTDPNSPSPFDQSALPDDPNVPIQQGPPPFRMVFLDPDRPWHTRYDDGGGVKRFTEYEISQDDFTKWLTDSKLDAKQDEIMQYMTAKKPMPADLYDKLKKQFADNKIGVNKGQIDVEYDSHKGPSTSKLDVNFIKSK